MDGAWWMREALFMKGNGGAARHSPDYRSAQGDGHHQRLVIIDLGEAS